MTVQFLPVSPHIGSPVLSRFRIEVVVLLAALTNISLINLSRSGSRSILSGSRFTFSSFSVYGLAPPHLEKLAPMYVCMCLSVITLFL